MRYSISLITILVALQLFYIRAELVQLTSQNFKENFKCELSEIQTHPTDLQHDWFIMFMAPWCGHCKTAKPQFQQFSRFIEDGQLIELVDEASESYNTLRLKAAVVDCIANRLLCGSFEIKGFPTFIYITKDRKGIKYAGPRNADSFLNFTIFHDPSQNHQHAQFVKLSHSIWDDIIAGVKMYWLQILLFGVLIPSVVGYGLGHLIYGRKIKKIENQAPIVAVDGKQEKEASSQKKQE